LKHQSDNGLPNFKITVPMKDSEKGAEKRFMGKTFVKSAF